MPALGYVVDYTQLTGRISQALQEGSCDYLAPATVSHVSLEDGAAAVDITTGDERRRVLTGLLVIADGGMQGDGSETVRVVDYRQTAVTARVAATEVHAHVAYERFTPEGPLALLPSGDKLALVWSTTPERAERLCAVPAEEFLHDLQRAFGNRLGRFISVERRARSRWRCASRGRSHYRALCASETQRRRSIRLPARV